MARATPEMFIPACQCRQGVHRCCLPQELSKLVPRRSSSSQGMIRHPQHLSCLRKARRETFLDCILILDCKFNRSVDRTFTNKKLTSLLRLSASPYYTQYKDIDDRSHQSYEINQSSCWSGSCEWKLLFAYMVVLAWEQFIEVHGTNAETGEERGLRHAPSEMEDERFLPMS